MIRLALGFFLSMVLLLSPVQGEPLRAGDHKNFPCPGCITRVPGNRAPGRPLPLLVALHGDGGEPTRMIEVLRREADRRNYVLLAPACPRNRGCKDGSWWRWAGPPAWLAQQVEAIARTMPVDPERIFVMGWSGGASYLAYSIGEMPAMFASLGLIGGGMQAREGGACSRCPVPAFLVSGDHNPLHALAVAARDGMQACGHAVQFTRLRGADHDGEWAALERRQAAEMFDFFAAHPGRCHQVRAAPAGTPAPGPGGCALDVAQQREVVVTPLLGGRLGYYREAPRQERRT